VLALEKSRGPLRQADPDAALELRKTLVGGRWSLVDRIELNGRRYILARENIPRAPGPAALSPKERQVVAYAKLGHSIKEIAYELGRSDSTVRVWFMRARRKLGVRSQRELLDSFDDGWCPPPTSAQ